MGNCPIGVAQTIVLLCTDITLANAEALLRKLVHA
jgi:hypothetical protein